MEIWKLIIYEEVDTCFLKNRKKKPNKQKQVQGSHIQFPTPGFLLASTPSFFFNLLTPIRALYSAVFQAINCKLQGEIHITLGIWSRSLD